MFCVIDGVAAPVEGNFFDHCHESLTCVLCTDRENRDVNFGWKAVLSLAIDECRHTCLFGFHKVCMHEERQSRGKECNLGGLRARREV